MSSAAAQPYLAAAEARASALLERTRRFIRTPSLPGREGEFAALLKREWEEAGLGEIRTDAAGNVLGRLKGEGTGPAVMWLAPLDHAPEGDPAAWSHGPYEAEVLDGHLLGRGASSNKAALAAMVEAARLLKESGNPLRGDVILAATVQSEHGANLGLRALLDQTLPQLGWHADLVVLGHPTGLQIALGHRGRAEIEVATIGRTCHAGVPWLGANAIAKMTGVVDDLQALASVLPTHPFLERSTIAVTGIRSLPELEAMIPDRCLVTVDRRFLPSEAVDDVVWQVQSVVNRRAANDPEFKAEVHVRQVEAASYTGAVLRGPKLLHPFTTEPHHALVAAAIEALTELHGERPRYTRWAFSTEGGYAATVKNWQTIGFGPGEEIYAQTPFDRVPVAHLARAAAGYAAIARHASGDPLS